MKKLIFGIVAGTVASSVATLLLTPKSGKQVRESLTRKYVETKIRLEGIRAAAKNTQTEHNTTVDNDESEVAKVKEAVTVSLVADEKNTKK